MLSLRLHKVAFFWAVLSMVALGTERADGMEGILIVRPPGKDVLLEYYPYDEEVVIDLNERALESMPPEGHKKLVVVPGASHLFEEGGALEQAARLARDWFQTHLDGVGVRE